MPYPVPHINSLSPNTGSPGTHVLISGFNFTASGFGPLVLFNNRTVFATVLSYTNTSIVCVVPPSAVTGNVTVENINFSNDVLFTVPAPPSLPTLTSLTPSNGPTGISVVVAGTNFGATQSTSKITFDGFAAMVISWSDTSITATVPSTANTGPVQVTTAAGASNTLTYTVTNPSNGGTGGPLNLLLIPAESFATPMIWAFDPTNFNDAAFGSSYSYKVEDVIAGRTPSVGRVIITVRDLGVATITATLSGTDQNTQAPVAEPATATFIIGTAGATGALLTYLPGLELTAQNLQLTISRAPNAGPVCIVKVRLEGRVEMTAYA